MFRFHLQSADINKWAPKKKHLHPEIKIWGASDNPVHLWQEVEREKHLGNNIGEPWGWGGISPVND